MTDRNEFIPFKRDDYRTLQREYWKVCFRAATRLSAFYNGRPDPKYRAEIARVFRRHSIPIIAAACDPAYGLPASYPYRPTPEQVEYYSCAPETILLPEKAERFLREVERWFPGSAKTYRVLTARDAIGTPRRERK